MTSPSDLTLQEDVLAAASGDRDAFGRLVVATSGLVTAIALSGSRDPEVARQAVPAVYLEVWDGLGRLVEPGGFLPWLRQVAHRQAARPAAAPAPEAGPGGPLLDDQRRALVREALGALPEEVREAVLLYDLEGHSPAQVGRLLGLSGPAVQERLARARALLGEAVAARLGEALALVAPGGDLVASVLARLPRREGAPAGEAALAGGFPTAMTAVKGMLGGVGAALLVLSLAGFVWRACGPAPTAPPPGASADRPGGEARP